MRKENDIQIQPFARFVGALVTLGMLSVVILEFAGIVTWADREIIKAFLVISILFIPLFYVGYIPGRIIEHLPDLVVGWIKGKHRIYGS